MDVEDISVLALSNTTVDKILKYGGIGSLIGAGLAYWLAVSVTATQRETLATLHEHQRDAQAQTEVLRVICAMLATGDRAQETLCRTVGTRPNE